MTNRSCCECSHFPQECDGEEGCRPMTDFRQWGIWNCQEKRFVFGISEPSEGMALRAFKRLAGKTSYHCKYEPRMIPVNHKNKPNPRREEYGRGYR